VLCTLTLYWAVQSAMLAVQLSIDRERGLRSMIDSWSLWSFLVSVLRNSCKSKANYNKLLITKHSVVISNNRVGNNCKEFLEIKRQ